MKKLTSLIVAAALIAPTAAYAQRHTTPGQAERHTENLSQDAERASSERENVRTARDEDNRRDQRVPAAKAGKVNVAAPAVGAPN